MQKLILIVLIALFTSPVFAEDRNTQNDVPYFTDGDLEKYKYPSDTESAGGSGQVGKTQDLIGNLPDVGLKGEQRLNRFAIPYKAYEGLARRIIIPVKLNGRVSAPMLLDTGAPGMLISFGLAKKLGILDKEEGNLWVNVGGVGGSVPAIYTIIDSVQVGEAEDHFIPTYVSDSVSGNFDGLIGMDFLTNYSIQIDTEKHEVIFQELPPRPKMPAGHDEAWWRITFSNFSSMKSTWKKYRESLDKQKGDPYKLDKLKKYADQQYKEAQNMYNRLWVYASTHAVPGEWR